MKQHTTNYTNSFIATADDCPTEISEVPKDSEKKSIARMQYERLHDAPYSVTSDDLLFEIHAIRKGIPAEDYDKERKAFFSKGQPCLRSSPLAKRYGWGFHFDSESRVAMIGRESEQYATLSEDTSVEQTKAMRSSRKS